MLLELRQYAEAARHLVEAWQLDPAAPGIAVNLGLARERLGDRSGAERWYREALQVNPGNARAARALRALQQH